MALISVDLVDGDAAGRAPLLAALQTAGFQVRAYAPAELGAALSASRPRVLLTKADPGAPAADRLLNELAEMQLAWLPVVFISTEGADRPFTQDFKTGVVDIWKPLSPSLLAQKLASLVAELPERNDGWTGSGDGKTLASFFAYARRTLRTGLLSVRDKQNEEGQVTLVQGQVRASSYQGRAKQDALKALSVLSQAQFTFSQPQHGAEPGAAFATKDDVFEDERTRTDGPEAVSAAIAVAAGTPAQPPAPATLEPVLLVDDDPDLRKLFSAFFSKKGYQVRTAEDGAAALMAATTELPGLILADLNMPRIDGWALLRFLREDVRTREVPVALFSAQDQYRDTLRAMQAGAQGFYPKTLRLDALEAQVRELLEPRARFRRIVSGKQGLAIDVGMLGPAWVLRALASLQFTGTLNTSDGWSRFKVVMTRGNLNEISSKTNNQSADGDRALAAFLLVKHADGSFAYDQSPVSSRIEPVAQALGRVLDALAAQQAAARASMLKDAKGFEVQPELYALYLHVGPPRLRDAARALCEGRIHPLQVAERTGLSVQEMEAFVLDLVRRGVMRLTP